MNDTNARVPELRTPFWYQNLGWKERWLDIPILKFPKRYAYFTLSSKSLQNRLHFFFYFNGLGLSDAMPLGNSISQFHDQCQLLPLLHQELNFC